VKKLKPQSGHLKKQLKTEIDGYLKIPTLAKSAETPQVWSWWNDNQNKFPCLSSFARKLLSAPVSSVYSERLFSEAENMYEKNRGRLVPQTDKQLLFIYHNLNVGKY